MNKPFQVIDNQTLKTIDFMPQSNDVWSVITKTNNSTIKSIMNNEQVESSYNYFSSHWIDYDINFG